MADSELAAAQIPGKVITKLKSVILYVGIIKTQLYTKLSISFLARTQILLSQVS